MFIDFLLQDFNWIYLLGIIIVIISLFSDSISSTSGAKNIQVPEITHIVNHQKGIVIDVRNKDEFAKGHIANSKNIPFSELESKLEKIKKWHKNPIVIICDNGVESRKAVKTLIKEGVENLHVLVGGLNDWRKENLPLVKNNK